MQEKRRRLVEGLPVCRHSRAAGTRGTCLWFPADNQRDSKQVAGKRELHAMLQCAPRRTNGGEMSVSMSVSVPVSVPVSAPAFVTRIEGRSLKGKTLPSSCRYRYRAAAARGEMRGWWSDRTCPTLPSTRRCFPALQRSKCRVMLLHGVGIALPAYSDCQLLVAPLWPPLDPLNLLDRCMTYQ